MRPRALLFGCVGLFSAVAACSGAGATTARVDARGPATIAYVPGQVLGVAQDGASVAWLQRTSSGCGLRVRPFGDRRTRAVNYASTCAPNEHDLVLARGRAAWGGYDELQCGKTYAAVFAAAGSRRQLVQKIPGDCFGFGTSYRGLVSDGDSFYYALLETLKPFSAWRCGEGGACRWRVTGGRIVRIDGGRAVKLKGFPPTTMVAAAAGRVALVEPLRFASSNGTGGVNWPRAARNGKVEVRSLRTGTVVTSFRPQGIVRAVALSATRAVVVVEYLGSRTIESYDLRSGRRQRAVAVAQSTRRIATDGHFVAFVARGNILLLDLDTGRERFISSTRTFPTGLSIRGGRLVWAENGPSTARVLTASVA